MLARRDATCLPGILPPSMSSPLMLPFSSSACRLLSTCFSSALAILPLFLFLCLLVAMDTDTCRPPICFSSLTALSASSLEWRASCNYKPTLRITRAQEWPNCSNNLQQTMCNRYVGIGHLQASLSTTGYCRSNESYLPTVQERGPQQQWQEDKPTQCLLVVVWGGTSCKSPLPVARATLTRIRTKHTIRQVGRISIVHQTLSTSVCLHRTSARGGQGLACQTKIECGKAEQQTSKFQLMSKKLSPLYLKCLDSTAVTSRITAFICIDYAWHTATQLVSAQIHLHTSLLSIYSHQTTFCLRPQHRLFHYLRLQHQ